MRPAKLSGISDLSGQISTVQGMGRTKSLTNVLFVPQSKHNLLSVGSLIDQVGGKVVFTRDKVRLELQNKVVSLGVRTTDGLYKVDNPLDDISANSKFATQKDDNENAKKVSFGNFTNISSAKAPKLNFATGKLNSQAQQLNSATGKVFSQKKIDAKLMQKQEGKSFISNAKVSLELKKQQVERLHRCFGHPNKLKLKQIVKNYPELKISNKEIDLLESCGSCALGKNKRRAKPKLSTTKATKFAERISSDCSGKIRTQSVSGKKYAWVAVDQYSGWVWSAPVASLKEVPELIRNLLEVNLHSKFDYSVEYFRSDNGSEFCNAQVDHLLKQYSIKRELKCPYTSYQNG